MSKKIILNVKIIPYILNVYKLKFLNSKIKALVALSSTLDFCFMTKIVFIALIFALIMQ